ncbi:MAG: hypothetical protein ACXW4G_03090 [Candidatus Deferrimicrobiaceae bacterium]|jgi:hypothetical protein
MLGTAPKNHRKELAREGGTMGQIVHTSRIVITREKGPTRKALIEGFAEPVYYGVHGGIKNFYKVDPEKEHAATLDHIVGAVGG